MDTEFLFHLCVFSALLKDIIIVSNVLQTKDCDIGRAYILIFPPRATRPCSWWGGGLSVPMIHQAVLVELLMPGRLVMRFQTKKWLDSKSNPKGTPSWRTLRDSQLEDLLRALVHPI